MLTTVSIMMQQSNIKSGPVRFVSPSRYLFSGSSCLRLTDLFPAARRAARLQQQRSRAPLLCCGLRSSEPPGGRGGGGGRRGGAAEQEEDGGEMEEKGAGLTSCCCCCCGSVCCSTLLPLRGRREGSLLPWQPRSITKAHVSEEVMSSKDQFHFL